MNTPAWLFVTLFLSAFGAITLYYAIRDLAVEIVWPWLRDKWQSRRKVAA
jgi:cell division protein FtsL